MAWNEPHTSKELVTSDNESETVTERPNYDPEEKQEPAKTLRISEHQLEHISKAHDEHKVQSQEPAFAQAAASGAAIAKAKAKGKAKGKKANRVTK